MPVDDRTQQPHGQLHGGASAAVAETLGSSAANLTLEPGEAIAVGLKINAIHIRMLKDGLVDATATAEALRRTTQICMSIADGVDWLACISRFTLAVTPATQT